MISKEGGKCFFAMKILNICLTHTHTSHVNSIRIFYGAKKYINRQRILSRGLLGGDEGEEEQKSSMMMT